MKLFTLKFIIASALFFIPVCYFQFIIVPNASGDIGKLGLIPFGKDQEGLDVSWYQREKGCFPGVVDVLNPDSLRFFTTITMGDSFSQYNKDGYQQSLSKCLGHTIANYQSSWSISVFESYVILLNKGYIGKGQTVILESVERSFVRRFSRLDSLESYDSLPEEPVNEENVQSEPFLNSFFSWIRQSAGYQNPIQRFSLRKACFTHNRFSRSLYVYNSKLIGDGDLMWSNISDSEYEEAARNMKKVIEFSENKGINLIIMIACDKYDVYEPWILGNHEENPTLDKIPQDKRIFVSRDCLRNAISVGTKDVYKLNNTHWSVVGADIVGESMFEWMMESELLP